MQLGKMRIRRWRSASVAVFLGIIGWNFAAYGAEDYTQWAHACNITLNSSATGANVATQQLGFPVLVRLTSATPAFSFAQAMTAGQDIRFSKSDGTHLPYQIERFDQANQLAEIWVKADVNGNDAAQYISMYWGKAGSADSSNGASVFNNGFAGVWHLGETGNINANGYADATGATPLTGVGMVAGDETNAVIGIGQNFGSANVSNILAGVTGKYLAAAAGPSETGESITAMVWAQLTGAASQQYIFNQGSPGDTRWDLGVNPTNPFPFEFDVIDHTSGNFATDVTGMDANWHLWVVTYDTLTPANPALAGAVAEGPVGTFTDQTAAANNVTANDMTLIRAVPAVNDAYYFGNATTFRAFCLHLGTTGTGAWTITWEYWNGAAWIALSGVLDGTKNTAGGNTGSLTLSGSISFTQPSDWANTTVDGIAAYWIRARMSAFTSMTTVPIGTQALCGPTVTIWKDGNLASTSVLWTRPTRSGEIDIATRADHTLLFKGIVDEPSIALGVRSADWINLCYQSQKPGASWQTFAAKGPAAPIKALFTVSDSIATAPAAIQFTDKSTGNFTKRLWYFGDGTVDSSNIANPLHEYTAPAIYIAKLVLLNGTFRADSFLVSFMITNTNPALVPVIIPYQPKVTQERRPLLSWHPVSGASTYTFVIDDNADFSSPISSFPLSDTSYKLLADLPFGTIYWKVKSNLIDVWSSVDKFTVVPDTIPMLIRYNGDSISTSRPVFAWHPVTNASDYLIQIANNSGFTNAMSLKVSDTAFVPLADLANGTWYWEVSCSRNYALFAPADSLMIGSTGLKGMKLSGAIKPFVSILKTAKGFSIATGGYEGGAVRAELYSVRGELATVFSNTSSGPTMIQWNGRDRFGRNCGNDVYILRVRIPGKVMTDRIILEK